MIKILSLLIFLSILISCDSPRECTEPKCIYSDVSATIPATLSGNLDSIIHIGDTIHLYKPVAKQQHSSFINLS